MSAIERSRSSLLDSRLVAAEGESARVAVARAMNRIALTRAYDALTIHDPGRAREIGCQAVMAQLEGLCFREIGCERT